MKKVETILNQLQKYTTNVEHEVIQLLQTLRSYNYGVAVNTTLLKLSNSIIIILEQELQEFKSNFNEQLDTNIEPDYNKNLKIYINSLYEYNLDFYLTDYKDSYKTVQNILNGSTDVYYLESNVYTLLASYIRMFTLYKIIYNLTNVKNNNYTSVFQFSKYKTITINKLNLLSEE